MRRGEEAFLGEDMQIMVNGLTMTYVDNFALRVEFTMHDVPLPDQPFIQNRKGQGRITGTMSGFTFSSYLFKIAMSQTQSISVVGILTNPKDKRKMKVEVQNVQFTTADLANWQVGSPVKFELPFVAANIREIENF